LLKFCRNILPHLWGLSVNQKRNYQEVATRLHVRSQRTALFTFTFLQSPNILGVNLLTFSDKTYSLFMCYAWNIIRI
jgi:hypothetical protein